MRFSTPLLVGGPVFTQLCTEERQTARERLNPKDQHFPCPNKIKTERINKPGKSM